MFAFLSFCFYKLGALAAPDFRCFFKNSDQMSIDNACVQTEAGALYTCIYICNKEGYYIHDAALRVVPCSIV